MGVKEDEEISIDFSKIKDKIKNVFKEKGSTSEAMPTSPEKELKDEEEITINLDKIKSLFKSDKAEKKEDQESKKDDAKKDDEYLSFDLSKVKKFFRQSQSEEPNDEDVSVDWKSIAGFLKKYGIIFIVLIPIILSVYVRMQAGFLPITDRWAVDTVMNSLRSQIKAGIDQQHPNLPEANKGTIIDTELQRVANENKAQLDQQIAATSAYFKSFFQDENGKNYMPDIDPYYWFRYAENIVERGHSGDILKDGKPFDTYQLAPVGRFVVPDMFHSYSLAYFYKFLHFFSPEVSLMRSSFYVPVFISALCVLLVFLIARKIGGDAGGFFGGLIMAVNSAFLGRTLFGHADNDIWVIFFPLLITWLFMQTIYVRNIYKILFLAILAGFFTGMFTFAWSGWWYIFDFLLGTIGMTFLYLVFINFKEIRKDIKLIFSNVVIRNIWIVGFVYFFSTAMFVVAFSGWSTFRNSFLGPLSFPSIKAPVASDLWPNVLTTVAELNEGSINAIINSVGGPFLFFISLLGLILAISRSDGIKKFDFVYVLFTALFYGSYFLLKKFGIELSVIEFIIWIVLPIFVRIAISVYRNDSSYDFKLTILLTLWIISTIFASIKGIRFTLLLAPAFSVAFGVALGKTYAYLSKGLTRELKIHDVISSGILIVLLLLLYVNPIKVAIGTAGSDIPLINDAWYNSLAAIKQGSSSDAIITSWWDFGHHFKALADRRVTFDGTTQTSAAAHWVGKLLMIDDETKSIGMLRMLDCGHNNAYSILFNINKDTHKSIKIINEIVALTGEDARKALLKHGLTSQQADDVLQYTHCDPPEAYFIASEDMIGKSGVWSHFGSWSFERADIWHNARRMQQEEAISYMTSKFNYTREKAENIYFEMLSIDNEPDANKRDSDANAWISPWPGYGGTLSCNKKDNVYVCNNGLLINLSGHDVYGLSEQGVVRPRNAAFLTEDGLFKKGYDESALDFGVTIIPKNNEELEAVISSKELTGSMFTKMFYMQGHGLRFFKPFAHERGLTGADIYVYKIDWEGKNTTIVEAYIDYLKEPMMEERVIENVNLSENNSITNSS